MTAQARYDVSVSSDWPATRDRWQASADASTATPFQSVAWLDAWYTTMPRQGEIDPVLVEVRSGGALALRLALIARRTAGQHVLQFADHDLTDFNAPILGPAAPETLRDAAKLWQALTRALPDIDLVDFRKMPLAVDGQANPLALLADTAPCPLTGHLITFTSDWNAYHAGLDRRVRMEFERCWRVFLKAPDATFVRLREAAPAQRAIDFLDRQQSVRMAESGLPFQLDRPREAAFYRHDLAQRLATGDVVVTAMMCGGEMVAALYGIANAQTTVILRIANAGPTWAKISPGRLIVHRTLHHLHETGVRAVDLSIGDYDYKRRMGPVATPLVDLVTALSWKGRAFALRHRAITAVRGYPAVEMQLRRILGRRDPATGKRVGQSIQ